MNDGMKIILERLKTHPEEFNAYGRDSKWENLVYRYADHLDEEDKQVFKDAIKQMRQEEFTAKVMEELIDPKEDNSLGKPWYSKQESITLTVGQTQGVSLTAEPLVNKKPKTLFGRLFNYS